MAHVARECAWTGACRAREARGRYQRSVVARGGAWQHVLVRQKLQPARVMQFLAVLGWVLLGIGCSVFLCLFFGS